MNKRIWKEVFTGILLYYLSAIGVAVATNEDDEGHLRNNF